MQTTLSEDKLIERYPPPQSILGVVLQGGSSSSRFLIREHIEKEPPLGGMILSIKFDRKKPRSSVQCIYSEFDGRSVFAGSDNGSPRNITWRNSSRYAGDPATISIVSSSYSRTAFIRNVSVTYNEDSAVPSYQRRLSSPRKREANVRFPTNLHGVRRSARPTSR